MKKLVCAILTLMLLMGSFAFAEEIERPAVAWDFGVPLSDVLSDYALLVNRDNMLDKSFKPTPLVKVKGVKRATSTAVEMQETAAEALVEMFNAAKLVFEYNYTTSSGKAATATYDENGMVLYLKSGYRNYGTQATVHANYLARNNNVDDGYSAPAGASEHQSGLAADILNADYASRSRMTQDFEWTPEAQWMKENCADFGFILRYTKNAEDITKTAYEPWHFRYVGESIAEYVMGREITFEAFVEESQAAYERFLSAGGDVDAWLAYEMAHLNKPPQSNVLDAEDETGDHEVSLGFI